MNARIPLLTLLLAVCPPMTHAEPGVAVDAEVAALLTRLKTAPEDYRANLRLGARYAALGRVANAEAAYRKAMQAAPDAFEPYHALCLLYFAHKRHADARATAEAWVERDPKSYYGRLCLADAQSLTGDMTKSLATLAQLHRNYPSDTVILYAMKARYATLGQKSDEERISRLIEEIRGAVAAPGFETTAAAALAT